jgi:hypothetical protein
MATLYSRRTSHEVPMYSLHVLGGPKRQVPVGFPFFKQRLCTRYLMRHARVFAPLQAGIVHACTLQSTSAKTDHAQDSEHTLTLTTDPCGHVYHARHVAAL